jgi:hypothetical protein
MTNAIGLNGGQPQKQTRFTPIYTGRFFSGLWTNRSPLRDAATTRLSEKFYGPTGDALIAGTNVEITNRLTLGRRPGNAVFDSNTYTNVQNFYSFRLFNANQEQIDVMIDTANFLYSFYNGTKSLVWSKGSGAGQTYMQSVGNSLYFGNGAENKKWLQSMTAWSSGAHWNGPTTPFMNTFLIDPNGNIQQLTACIVPVTQIQIASNVLTVTSSQSLSGVLTTGLQITFPSGMAASFLNGQTVTVTAVTGNTFTAAFTHANYGPTAETNITATVVKGGTPISGSSTPTWSGTPLTPGMATPSQALTNDGTAQWTNRGTSVKNWGIVAPTTSPSPTIGSSRSAWAQNTFYSVAGVVLDSNGNLQQVQTAGKTGSSAPTWATTLNATTTDGTVTWKLIQLAASLTWAAHTAYTAGSFLVANAGGTNCLFQLAPITQPSLNGNVSAYIYNASHTGAVGAVKLTNPTLTGSAAANATVNSLRMTGVPTSDGASMSWVTTNGAGESVSTSNPFPSFTNNYDLVMLGAFTIPVAGQYTFTVKHHDGMIWGIGGGATVVSGPNNNALGQTITPVQGYPVFGGNNSTPGTGQAWTDTFVVNFPTAGTYNFEFDFDYWYHTGLQFDVQINGAELANGTAISGTTQPSWPAWSTSYAPNYPNVKEAANRFQWNNLGPTSDYTWLANTNFSLPNATIIDPAGNTESPYRAGVTGTNEPTFATGQNQLTTDNPNLIWINQGVASAPAPGTISTFDGGWEYGIALVNTVDNTVSNCGPLSPATGNFIGASGVSFAAGTGLPAASQIDPQCDYVAIFRTTDGLTSPFLIPGTGNSTYTVPLATYLASGYTDTTADTGLNNLISAPIAGENTPPAAGAVNLTYHLNRIFFSVGNVVYWTSGPDAPVGNGANGVAPLNFSVCPSLVTRIVPTTIGAIVFTVSDVYLITGQGTTTSPIQKAVPYLQGVGLLSYNALEVNGSIIGLFTTDKQFIILNPDAGVSYAGFPIGDQLRQNTGAAGTAWNPSKAYVTWHVNGEDQAWYLCDGQFGWYRLMATPAPETGYTWSPFASIVGGCQAVKSIETSPGVRNLLVSAGPTSTGGSTPTYKYTTTGLSGAGAKIRLWGTNRNTLLVFDGSSRSVSTPIDAGAGVYNQVTNVGGAENNFCLIDAQNHVFTGGNNTHDQGSYFATGTNQDPRGRDWRPMDWFGTAQVRSQVYNISDGAHQWIASGATGAWGAVTGTQAAIVWGVRDYSAGTAFDGTFGGTSWGATLCEPTGPAGGAVKWICGRNTDGAMIVLVASPVLATGAGGGKYHLSVNLPPTNGTTAQATTTVVAVEGASVTPSCMIYDASSNSVIFLMSDGTLQKWSVSGTPTLTATAAAPVSGLNIANSAITMFRATGVQQTGVTHADGTFFLWYTNGSGHNALAQVSGASLATIATYDLDALTPPIALSAGLNDMDYHAGNNEVFITVGSGLDALNAMSLWLKNPAGSGPILNRDLSTYQDNGSSYAAWAVIGSLVLAQPGQVAEVAFVTIDSVNLGTPLTLGILIDEALPYWTGPFETLKGWEPDPPGLPPSRSTLGQRFYLSELTDQAALCRHLQIRLNWVTEAQANELLSMTVYGAFMQES